MRLIPGDAAPWFVARSVRNPRFHLDTAAGRYLLLYFAGSLNGQTGRAIEQAVLANLGVFDGYQAAALLISADPGDEAGREEQPGLKYFWDFDRVAAQHYGLADEQAPFGVQPAMVLLDRGLRVVAIKKLGEHALAEAELFLELARRTPPLPPSLPAQRQAPVLVMDRIFEPALCRALVDYCTTKGTIDSGYMQQVGERTVGVIDYGHKRRQDCWLEEPGLIEGCRSRIVRRLVPEIKKVFQFDATRIERFLIGCYDAGVGGYFRPHRDNTTMGTAHRRFAVTINLNAEEYEGGDLRFPEYGTSYYRAPTGGAVVFSCSVLHEALPVTRGVRYTYLPFLYDEQAKRIREANLQAIDARRMRLDHNRQPVPIEDQDAAGDAADLP